MRVTHKKYSVSGSTGGLLGLFFITANECNEPISKQNKWDSDWKNVTCKRCLKRKK